VPDEIQIKYHKRSRSIRLKADSAGRITVTAHPLTPKFLINRFIKQSQPWINKHRSRGKKRDSAVSQGELKLFGETYQRQIGSSNLTNHNPGIYIDDKTLVFIPTNPLQSPKKLQSEFDRKLKDWLKRTCHTYVSRRLVHYSEEMKLKYNRVSLKNLTSRWGSCSSQGNLNFNWRLVHFPPDVIDYVIVHELAHLKEPNHSKQFWQLVAKHDSSYKKHKRQLQQLAV